MSIKILIDMNLSPDWVSYLQSHGWDAAHWSQIGQHSAADETIMKWASAHGYIVFTHDLDFGTILALTHRDGPSVIQIRAQNIFPTIAGNMAVAAIRLAETDLAKGALVVVSENKSRIRILPL